MHLIISSKNRCDLTFHSFFLSVRITAKEAISKMLSGKTKMFMLCVCVLIFSIYFYLFVQIKSYEHVCSVNVGVLIS